MSAEEREAADQDARLSPDPADVATRSQLLPEERAVDSDDPQGQAEAVLTESAERTEHPDADGSTQTGRRRSEDTI
jgi:hypothetical protein